MFRVPFSLLLALLLYPVCSLSSHYDVSAEGKSEAIAFQKARFNALRSAVGELRSKEFLRKYSKDVRNQIFLKIDEFIKKSDDRNTAFRHENGIYTVTAKIDVDKEKLLQILNVIGDEIDPYFSMLEQESDVDRNTFDENMLAEKTTDADAGGIDNPVSDKQEMFIEIKAEGIGGTKSEALKNAWIEAVRQAVGIYLA
jgi:hypothetical protein